MAGSIQEFVAGMPGGGSRPNRFEIVSSRIPNMHLYAKASSLPASTLGKCETPYMGRIINFVGDRTFDDWNVTVYNDVGHPARTAVLAWMSQMNTHLANTGGDGTGYYDEGTEVRQLTRNNTPDVIYTFINMFPIACGDVTLGWDQNDQVEEFEVTFALNAWVGPGAG